MKRKYFGTTIHQNLQSSQKYYDFRRISTLLMLISIFVLSQLQSVTIIPCVNCFHFSLANQYNPTISRDPDFRSIPPFHTTTISPVQQQPIRSTNTGEDETITTNQNEVISTLMIESDVDIQNVSNETTAGNNASNTSVRQEALQQQQQQRNTSYLQGLYDNLHAVLDQYMISGNEKQQQIRAYNILQQIQLYETNNNTGDDTLTTTATTASYYQRAQRLIQRTGLSIENPEESSSSTSSSARSPVSSNLKPEQDQQDNSSKEKGVVFGWSTSNTDQRRNDVNQRKEWEQQQQKQQTQEIQNPPSIINNGEPLQREKQYIQDKILLEKEMKIANNENVNGNIPGGLTGKNGSQQQQQQQSQSDPEEEAMIAARSRISAFMARASRMDSNHHKFDGSTFGIGGLDEILQQIQRRIYIPLISPPQLLTQLGMTPVRGLLLYGPPGCGKTLMAREIGQYISPFRPITVISGPEIMDKFVGSSEMKLRNIFDNPPNLYETVRQQEPDQGVALSKVALHVIIMDEFDAIARQRGGRDNKNGGGSDQGDAGVARDSVVNQLLAKMDGVLPLPVPTLVIGVTNKRSLIDTALLRPGRFEIQIEVPPPKTIEQRISILQIHSRHMYVSGRLLVQDAPIGTAAADLVAKYGEEDRLMIPTYTEILETMANKTENFTGASLAAVVRAAASFALERSVSEYISNVELNSTVLQECVVTIEDFLCAIADFDNMDGSDSSEQPTTEDTVNSEFSVNGK